MTSSQQSPTDVGQLMALLQTIKERMDSQKDSDSYPASITAPQILTILPSRAYGTTNVSDKAHAVLGDVYHFYDHDQSEQRLILQEFKDQMESFCQKQDRRDERLQRVLHLITEINHGLGSEGSSLGPPCHTLTGQQLLSMIEPSSSEISAEQTLELCRSIAQRRQSQLTFVKPTSYMSEINQWLSTTGSVLLHLTAKPSAEDHMSDIIVQMAVMLKDSGFPIIWSSPEGPEPIYFQTLLRDIVSQLMELRPDIVIETDSLMSRSVLEQPLRIDVWTQLLGSVLNSIKKAFLILNILKQPSCADRAARYHNQLIAATINAVDQAQARNNVVKVMVFTGSTIATDTQLVGLENCISCAVDAIPTSIALAKRSSTHARSLSRQLLLDPVLSID